MSTAVTEGGEWIRCFDAESGGATRLICFPHAGGSASFFRPLSMRLAPEVDVLAIQYPGRQDRYREPVITEIGELADRIATELAALPGPPPVYLGHSMGAVLAFEVAQRLEARDRNGPRALLLSGRRAPSKKYVERNVHLKPDDDVIAELKLLSGTSPDLLGDDEMLRLVLPAIRGDFQAVETYLADPESVVGCPITALVGDADPLTTVDEARAWGRHTSAAFEAKVFAGGHFYLAERQPEVIEEIRKQLRHLSAPADASGN
ncbi:MULTISPECIES: thioesterase II family protein [Saccharopolyspora]|uniref:Thioesterase n=1 Tax=Saccharopolyspora elongata TaxID=2530387 RepID=A0A4R4YZC7_9PSEU|nr:alpha/beta fold hydrolase [Saccharopolyspora elongata]TDD50921.1 thioesterase [Saccharopolyspora elongata]